MKKKARKCIVLMILDGVGHSALQKGNAVAQASLPCLTELQSQSHVALLAASGEAVGLPKGQIGNSEVGHLTLGSGRVVYQDLSRINREIETGSFQTNPVFQSLFEQVKTCSSTLHVMGLLSSGGVHSHEEHLFKFLEMAAAEGITSISLHLFLDGRDVSPKSAETSLMRCEQHMAACGCGSIASIVGRYYAMDRDQRWERTEAAYRLIAYGEGAYEADTPLKALELAYQRGESDEFVQPTRIRGGKGSTVQIRSEDYLFFFNFRSDRARQLTEAFLGKPSCGFKGKVQLSPEQIVTLTEYNPAFGVKVAYGTESMEHTLGAYLSEHNKRQLRASETEKYAHVTFFFNGGIEIPCFGEDRIMIPSPKVATYDLQPEMSAIELTKQLVEKILSEQYDVIIVNYPNGDMVGHTGVFEAAIKAMETLDWAVGQIVAAVKTVGAILLVTADHGNIEKMIDEHTGSPHTAHTENPVPLYMYPKEKLGRLIDSKGSLADVAPTILFLLGLSQPNEMTGRSLLS